MGSPNWSWGPLLQTVAALFRGIQAGGVVLGVGGRDFKGRHLKDVGETTPLPANPCRGEHRAAFEGEGAAKTCPKL